MYNSLVLYNFSCKTIQWWRQRASIYCRSASLCLCPHVSCLQFIFSKLKATGKDIHRTSHMCLCELWLYVCVCICMCDFMLCGFLWRCLCVWLSVCAYVRTRMWSRTLMKCLQQWTRAQTVTEVIMVRSGRNYKSYTYRSYMTPIKVHYTKILFYSILHCFYIFIYTLSQTQTNMLDQLHLYQNNFFPLVKDLDIFLFFPPFLIFNLCSRIRKQDLFVVSLWRFWVSGLLSSGSLCDVPLPNPEMSFHLWWEEEELCKWDLFTKIFWQGLSALIALQDNRVN